MKQMDRQRNACRFGLIMIMAVVLVHANAQEEQELLSLLGREETTEYAAASFKTNHVINLHSLESTSDGGHVFQLHFTNSTSMTEKGFITETIGKWGKGQVHPGFNISRVFTLVKPSTNP